MSAPGAAPNAALTAPRPVARSYKAYFRWTHYPFKIRINGVVLPTETDACPSVTAAFLQVRGPRGAQAGDVRSTLKAPPLPNSSSSPQVLHTLHAAEVSRIGPKRNVLQVGVPRCRCRCRASSGHR
jgi:hypothetical protein